MAPDHAATLLFHTLVAVLPVCAVSFACKVGATAVPLGFWLWCFVPCPRSPRLSLLHRLSQNRVRLFVLLCASTLRPGTNSELVLATQVLNAHYYSHTSSSPTGSCRLVERSWNKPLARSYKLPPDPRKKTIVRLRLPPPRLRKPFPLGSGTGQQRNNTVQQCALASWYPACGSPLVWLRTSMTLEPTSRNSPEGRAMGLASLLVDCRSSTTTPSLEGWKFVR